jgi:hypothetical protein
MNKRGNGVFACLVIASFIIGGCKVVPDDDSTSSQTQGTAEVTFTVSYPARTITQSVDLGSYLYTVLGAKDGGAQTALLKDKTSVYEAGFFLSTTDLPFEVHSESFCLTVTVAV